MSSEIKRRRKAAYRKGFADGVASMAITDKPSPGDRTRTGETARGERCELPPPSLSREKADLGAVAAAIGTDQVRSVLSAGGLVFEPAQDAFLEGIASLAVAAMDNSPGLSKQMIDFSESPITAEEQHLIGKASAALYQRCVQSRGTPEEKQISAEHDAMMRLRRRNDEVEAALAEQISPSPSTQMTGDDSRLVWIIQNTAQVRVRDLALELMRDLRAAWPYQPDAKTPPQTNMVPDDRQSYPQGMTVNDLDAARKWLAKRWCVEHPNEGHVKQLAEYAASLRTTPPQTNVDVEDKIARVVQSVSEWDDRTSPDDYPDHLLITSEELSEILRNFAETLEGRDNG